MDCWNRENITRNIVDIIKKGINIMFCLNLNNLIQQNYLKIIILLF